MKISLNRVDRIYLALFILFLVLVYFSQHFTPYDPIQVDMKNTFAGLSSEHLLGTDYLGRDVFSRIIAGSKSTIFTSVFILIISVVIGTILGLVSGYLGGKTDWVIMRLVDTAMVFPDYIIAILISGVLGGGGFSLIFAVVFVKWFSYCKIARSTILAEKSKEYISIAKLDGMKAPEILAKHLLPYALGSIVAVAIVDLGKIILLIASLSYLGMGFQPPNPEWGAMLSDGKNYFLTNPQMMLIPGLAIFATVLIINVFGARVARRVNVREKAGD